MKSSFPSLPSFASLALLCVSALNSFSATVVGNLTDISLQTFNTKLIFTPTNEVQIGATATALDNANVHIGADGSCGFGLLGTPFHISPSGDFDRLSIGDEGEHSFNGDGSFSLSNGTFTSDTAGNLSAHSFTTSGDIEI